MSRTNRRRRGSSENAEIEEALHEYVSRREQQRILNMFGTVDYDEGYDYKKQRARR